MHKRVQHRSTIRRAALAAAQRAARLRRLHEAALTIAAPVPAEPDQVAALLTRIVERAAAALGGRTSWLVLPDDTAWRDLVPGSGPADGVITLEHTGQLGRVPVRPQGATRHALSRGVLVEVPETLAAAGFGPYPALAESGVRAFAILPLQLGGCVLGALGVSFARPGVLRREDREALELFAAHAAAALERVRQVYAERRRATQAERLAATLASVGASSDLESALEALLRGAIALLNGDHGAAHVFAPRPGQGSLRLRIDRTGALEARPNADPPLAGSFTAALQAGGPAVVIDDCWALDPAAYPLYERLRRRGLRAAVHVPIDAGGQRIGSLSIAHHQPGFFGPVDLAVTEALATRAGATIERARLMGQLAALNAQLQRLSSLDGLTGVANRRRFDEFFEREWRRAARQAAPLSLIMIDIDHFKRFNDTYGHQAGDRCLKQVAAAIRGTANRPGDLAARYGGEEFAIVLSDTGEAGAALLAAAARASVEALAIPHAQSPTSDRVTVSVGVASTFPAPGASPVDLVGAADRALYAAKQDGRDRVCAARAGSLDGHSPLAPL